MSAWLGAFGACFRSDLLKLRRTHALVLPLLLSAAPPLVFFVYVLQRGTGGYPVDVSPIAWTVQGTLSIWGSFLLPAMVAVECSLLASIEHGGNGWKHLLALPLPRSAVYASKFAMAGSLIALAHGALFVYTLAAGWGLGRMRADAGFGGSLYVRQTLLLVFLVGLGGALLVGIHAVVALRWPTFAINIGLALGGLLIGVVLVESRLRNFYPWSLPSAVQNIAWPLVFGLRGRAGPLEVAALVAISSIACFAVMALGTWWLGRRDVP